MKCNFGKGFKARADPGPDYKRKQLFDRWEVRVCRLHTLTLTHDPILGCLTTHQYATSWVEKEKGRRDDTRPGVNNTASDKRVMKIRKITKTGTNGAARAIISVKVAKSPSTRVPRQRAAVLH